MKRFDRNQFLLLATAIGAATAATGAKTFPETVTSEAATRDDEEQDQTAGACDGDTGQTGRAKYCPMAEGRRKGCLDWTFCDDTGLKAASELRLFDCLATSPVNSCSVEGATTPFVRCSQQVVNHACADTAATATCQRVQRTCGRAAGSMMQSCTTYVTPMTSAGKAAFVSCMVEGCSDDAFKACTLYMH
jgi:hypothetical protein